MTEIRNCIMSTEDQNRSKGQEYIDNKNSQVEEKLTCR